MVVYSLNEHTKSEKSSNNKFKKMLYKKFFLFFKSFV